MTFQNREVRRLVRRFEPSPEARITAAVCKLLAAIEAGDAEGEVAAAYQSALRRHGEGLGEAGGVSAMRAALEAVCAARPDWVAERRATITRAWAGIEGWKP